MYALYILGSQMETFMGKKKFSIIYFLSALAGSLLSIALSSSTVSVGASGAIFGLMGSLIYFGYNYRVYFGQALKNQILPVLVLNLFLTFTFTGIDIGAHIGGLIGGTLVTMAIGIPEKESESNKMNGMVLSAIFFAFITYIAFIGI
jgi:rhomboid protease GluP